MTSGKTRPRIILIGLLSGAAIAAPYLFVHVWPQLSLHHVFLYLIFLPVFLTAFWFGFTRALLVSAATGAGLVPLLAGHRNPLAFGERVEDLVEVLLLLCVAVAIGYLAKALRRERERVEQSVEDLESAFAEVSAKTSQLFSADDQLRRGERLRLLGELSSELAHEIQNPLASIKGTAEIINDRCKRLCGTGDFLEILMSEIQRLRSVLDRFLDFARNQDTEGALCDPLKSLGDVARLMTHPMEKQRIDFTVRAPETPLRVMISDEQLKQVFLNLVLNAVQAMPEGGEISAVFEEVDSELSIKISDTGPGIKDANRELVFDPFFSTKRGGTGLGLAITWRILKKNKGSIVLAPRGSSPGASFVITLPLATEVPESANAVAK